MSHYFHTPDEPLVTHEFTATVFGRELTFTAAPATGRPVSSAVTHARLASRPHLKCTAMLVTSAPAAT